MAHIVFEGAKEDARVVYKIATVSLFHSSPQVADVVVLILDQLSFAVFSSLFVLSFVREFCIAHNTEIVTIAIDFTAKELSRVKGQVPSRQRADSLPEPIHELPGVDDVFDAVQLNGLTMDFTMNEGSLIGESSTSLL